MDEVLNLVTVGGAAIQVTLKGNNNSSSEGDVMDVDNNNSEQVHVIVNDKANGVYEVDLSVKKVISSSWCYIVGIVVFAVFVHY